MEQPTYQGFALDAETALALLEWQIEMGADVPVLDMPVDRFDLPRHPAPSGQPLMVPDQPLIPALAADDVDDLAARVAAAEQAASGASTLAELAKAQEAFDGIELKKGARRFCFSDGDPRARVLVLGEAPGDEEDRQGRPFVGRAGQLLDKMFRAIGLARDSVDAAYGLYLCNVLTWRPPGNREPLPDEIAVSLPFLQRHIALAQPKLIVLMGNVACDAAIRQRGILKLRGQWVQAFGRPALPMTHPAYLLRNPQAKREAWADLLDLAARLETLSD
ncbi:MAG: uracil-DNA glycosylase [Paracoccus sp. (in: a-proteobacteria)]|nr:uracil-DNA glycosylase [Paracoccus sp. (in: a-proteobacteria)]